MRYNKEDQLHKPINVYKTKAGDATGGPAKKDEVDIVRIIPENCEIVFPHRLIFLVNFWGLGIVYDFVLITLFRHRKQYTRWYHQPVLYKLKLYIQYTQSHAAATLITLSVSDVHKKLTVCGVDGWAWPTECLHNEFNLTVI